MSDNKSMGMGDGTGSHAPFEGDVGSMLAEANRAVAERQASADAETRRVFEEAVVRMGPLITLLQEAKAAGVEVALRIEPPRNLQFSRECSGALMCPEIGHHAMSGPPDSRRYDLMIGPREVSVCPEGYHFDSEGMEYRSVDDLVSEVRKGIVAHLAAPRIGEVAPELPDPFVL